MKPPRCLQRRVQEDFPIVANHGFKQQLYHAPIDAVGRIPIEKMQDDGDQNRRQSYDSKALNWFTIAGADRRFQPAVATIDGEMTVVHSRQVKNPVAVRFGWNDVAQPNLVNGAGLPASPFRTDDWRAVTANRR